MKIARLDIEKLLREAVTAGINGVDREIFLTKISGQFSSPEESVDNDFRMYSIEELREVKPGAVFEHSRYGLCRFDIYDGELVGFFEGPILAYARLSVGNRPPWNKPMRRVSAERWVGN